MYPPRWLFLYWRRRIYLRSIGWQRTRRRVLNEQGAYCHHWKRNRGKIVTCRETIGLQIHHRDHSGQPKPRWYHFLPFGRFLLWEIDTSDLVPLCDYHHKMESR